MQSHFSSYLPKIWINQDPRKDNSCWSKHNRSVFTCIYFLCLQEWYEESKCVMKSSWILANLGWFTCSSQSLDVHIKEWIACANEQSCVIIHLISLQQWLAWALTNSTWRRRPSSVAYNCDLEICCLWTWKFHVTLTDRWFFFYVLLWWME